MLKKKKILIRSLSLEALSTPQKRVIFQYHANVNGSPIKINADYTHGDLTVVVSMNAKNLKR